MGNSSSESVVQEESWQSTQHPSFSALPPALPSSQQSGEQHRQLRPKKREHGVRGQRSRRPSPSTDGTPKSLETSPGWRSTRWTSTTAAPWCWTPSSRSRMRWTPALLSGGAVGRALRLLRYEHRRSEHTSLPLQDRRQQQDHQDLPPAPHVCGEGLGARHEQLLPAVQKHPALAAGRGEGCEEGGAPAEPSVR